MVTFKRKKRYFILRRDISALCYYVSREDLTLLGSIPLDADTTLANIKAEEAGKSLRNKLDPWYS